jgi:hypothetical protein
MEKQLEAGSRSLRDDSPDDLRERDTLYGRALGPGWVEVEQGIFVRRDGEHVLPPPHVE